MMNGCLALLIEPRLSPTSPACPLPGAPPAWPPPCLAPPCPAPPCPAPLGSNLPPPCPALPGVAAFERAGVEYKEGDDMLAVLAKLPLTNYEDYRSTMDTIVELGDQGCSDEAFKDAHHRMVSNDELYAIMTTSGTTGDGHLQIMYVDPDPECRSRSWM